MECTRHLGLNKFAKRPVRELKHLSNIFNFTLTESYTHADPVHAQDYWIIEVIVAKINYVVGYGAAYSKQAAKRKAYRAALFTISEDPFLDYYLSRVDKRINHP
jgi:hypothetical protein